MTDPLHSLRLAQSSFLTRAKAFFSDLHRQFRASPRLFLVHFLILPAAAAAALKYFFFHVPNPHAYSSAALVSLIFVGAFPRKTLPVLISISFFYSIYYIGYNAFSFNQAQYLIQPFKEIYPVFCPGDWFTWQVKHYHYFFSFLIQFLHWAFMGNLRIGMYLAWITFLLINFYGYYFLAKKGRGGFAHFTLIVLLFGLYAREFAFWPAGYGSWLLPNYTAFAVAIYAIGFFMAGRYRAAFFTLGGAALMHIHFGAILFPVFAATLLLSERRKRVLEKCADMAPFFILSFPVVLLTLFNFGGEGKDPGLFGSLILLRAPIHYLTSHQPESQLFFTFAPLVYGAVAPLVGPAPRSDRAHKLLLMMIAVMTVCHVFVEAGGPALFVRLNGWRILALAVLLSYRQIAMDVLDRERLRSMGPVLGVFFFYWAFKQFGVERGPWIFLSLVSAGLLITLVKFHWANKVLCSVLLVLGLTGGELAKREFKAFPFQAYHWKTEATRGKLYTWVKENTPDNALFLTPPGSYQMFRVATHRGIVVDFKSSPIGRHEDLEEWYERLNTAANIPRKDWKRSPLWWRFAKKLNRSYYKMEPKDALRIMKKYGATHFLTRNHSGKTISQFERAGFRSIYKSGRTIVYERVKQ